MISLNQPSCEVRVGGGGMLHPSNPSRDGVRGGSMHASGQREVGGGGGGIKGGNIPPTPLGTA